MPSSVIDLCPQQVGVRKNCIEAVDEEEEEILGEMDAAVVEEKIWGEMDAATTEEGILGEFDAAAVKLMVQVIVKKKVDAIKQELRAENRNTNYSLLNGLISNKQLLNDWGNYKEGRVWNQKKAKEVDAFYNTSKNSKVQKRRCVNHDVDKEQRYWLGKRKVRATGWECLAILR